MITFTTKHGRMSASKIAPVDSVLQDRIPVVFVLFVLFEIGTPSSLTNRGRAPENGYRKQKCFVKAFLKWTLRKNGKSASTNYSAIIRLVDVPRGNHRCSYLFSRTLPPWMRWILISVVALTTYVSEPRSRRVVSRSMERRGGGGGEEILLYNASRICINSPMT